jgi:uncharacterized protein (TIRG00374 family)
MTNGRRGWLPVVGGIVISVAAVLFLAWAVDLSQTWTTLSAAHPWPLAAVLPIVAVQLVIRSWRWRLLLAVGPGGAAPRVRRLLPVLAIGYLGNSVLPARLGEPIRAWLVARREGLSVASALGSVAFERLIDVASLAAVAAVASATSGGPAWITRGAVAVAAAATIVIVTLVAVDVPAVARRLGALLGRRAPWIQGGMRHIVAFSVAVGGQRRPAIVAAAIVSSVAWLMDGLSFWSVATALQLGISPAAALVIAAVAVLGTAIPSAPGYVGTFELAAVAAGTAVGLHAGEALALAVAAHFLVTVPLAALGAAAAISLSVDLRAAADAAVRER